MNSSSAQPSQAGTAHHFRSVSRFLTLLATVLLFTLLSSSPAGAASGDITSVIESIRNWAAGILAALATLFLTVGGVRYLTAQGNPRAIEEAKAGIKAALIGYGLAALAPTLVSILQKVLRT